MCPLPMQNVSIGGAGNCCLDYLFVAPRAQKDSVSPVRECTIQGGGLTATALVACARLGANTRFISLLGDDFVADDIEKELETYGVKERIIHRLPKTTSPVSFIHVEPETGHRTIYHHCPSTLKEYEVQNLSCLAGCNVVLVDDVYPQLGLGAAHFARERGIPVIADIALGDTNHPFLAAVDVVIAPASEREEFESDRLLKKELSRIQRLGPPVVLVTLGARGWAALGPEGFLRGAAFPVPVVDTTGAGDVFHGAFGFAWARGWDMGQCARFAAATAALKCTRLGGRAGIPTLEEVTIFMRQNNHRSTDK